MNFLKNISKFIETYTSSMLAITEKNIAINIIMVYLISSVFMFTLLFIILWWNFAAFSAKTKIAGKNMTFWIKREENTNTLPPFIPKLAIIAEIVYPIEKPLYPTTIYIK